ncbi:DUF5058 family protein [Mycoplasma sp. P36-A1]|uniref:DUF5058 family protein n=1 Tax=Mycoplasma sp. P36-A1 TaxID=3252900 RepID=UPI003C2EF37F
MKYENYLDFANSWGLFIICAIVILFVILQSILFYKKAYSRGLEIGIDKNDLKRITKSSGIFAIVPALPILIFLLMLSPGLGKFFPWLRLSVVGSGMYENMVANQVASALGAPNFDGLDTNGFIIMMFTMTIAICSGIFSSVFFLKPMSKKLTKMENDTNSFGPHLVPAMFVGLLVALGGPYFLPKIAAATGKYEINILSAIVVLISAATFLALTSFAKKKESRTLSEFAFPLAIVVGMIAAIILSQFGIGVVIL